MPHDIRLWSIENDRLRERRRRSLDFEDRLEGWIAGDPGIISRELMIIGRHVKTGFGGIVDLLGLDDTGDVVIINLKRDTSPRDVSAQALDFAAWAQHLSNGEVTAIADIFLGAKGPLEDAFQHYFGKPLPESLNDGHRIVIIGSELDPASERIIKYLSEGHGVDIKNHSAKPVTGELVRGADLVLAMTRRHKKMLISRYPDAEDKIFTLREYAGTGVDIADPYGGSLSEFRESAERIIKAIDFMEDL